VNCPSWETRILKHLHLLVPIMQRKTANILILFLTGGMLWYASFMLYFLVSGAQNILSNPAYQSAKFLYVFMQHQPLPRVDLDPWILYAGLYIVCSIMLIVFVNVIDAIKGNWLSKGLKFGFINWALAIPWFEFYLPFNVMHEPLLLVLLEALLWLATLVTVAIVFSFIYHSGPKDIQPKIIVYPEKEVLSYRSKT
jgi:hypothetical protein